MYKQKKNAFMWLMLLFLIAFVSHSSFGKNNLDINELSYLRLKGECKYEEAINVLLKWSLELHDPYLVELNVFRINEMMFFPELFDQGIMTLRMIRKLSLSGKYPFLQARIDHMLNKLLLKKGSLAESQDIIKSFGFFDFLSSDHSPERAWLILIERTPRKEKLILPIPILVKSAPLAGTRPFLTGPVKLLWEM